MITVTIFDAASGVVSRTLSLAVPAGEEAVSIALNLAEGEAYVDGDWPGERWRISDGIPLEMPDRPGAWAVFDAASWQWVDPRTAADLAAEAAAARSGLRLSRRQLLIGLVSEGWISEAEALVAATAGTLPAAVDAAILTLPLSDRLAARITWAAFVEARRLDPLVALLAAGQGLTDEQVDAFFTSYAAI